jgi:hypothetical protein
MSLQPGWRWVQPPRRATENGGWTATSADVLIRCTSFGAKYRHTNIESALSIGRIRPRLPRLAIAIND